MSTANQLKKSKTIEKESLINLYKEDDSQKVFMNLYSNQLQQRSPKERDNNRKFNTDILVQKQNNYVQQDNLKELNCVQQQTQSSNLKEVLQQAQQFLNKFNHYNNNNNLVEPQNNYVQPTDYINENPSQNNEDPAILKQASKLENNSTSTKRSSEGITLDTQKSQISPLFQQKQQEEKTLFSQISPICQTEKFFQAANREEKKLQSYRSIGSTKPLDGLKTEISQHMTQTQNTQHQQQQYPQIQSPCNSSLNAQIRNQMNQSTEGWPMELLEDSNIFDQSPNFYNNRIQSVELLNSMIRDDQSGILDERRQSFLKLQIDIINSKQILQEIKEAPNDTPAETTPLPTKKKMKLQIDTNMIQKEHDEKNSAKGEEQEENQQKVEQKNQQQKPSKFKKQQKQQPSSTKSQSSISKTPNAIINSKPKSLHFDKFFSRHQSQKKMASSNGKQNYFYQQSTKPQQSSKSSNPKKISQQQQQDSNKFMKSINKSSTKQLQQQQKNGKNNGKQCNEKIYLSSKKNLTPQSSASIKIQIPDVSNLQQHISEYTTAPNSGHLLTKVSSPLDKYKQKIGGGKISKQKPGTQTSGNTPEKKQQGPVGGHKKTNSTSTDLRNFDFEFAKKDNRKSVEKVTYHLQKNIGGGVSSNKFIEAYNNYYTQKISSKKPVNSTATLNTQNSVLKVTNKTYKELHEEKLKKQKLRGQQLPSQQNSKQQSVQNSAKQSTAAPTAAPGSSEQLTEKKNYNTFQEGSSKQRKSQYQQIKQKSLSQKKVSPFYLDLSNVKSNFDPVFQNIQQQLQQYNEEPQIQTISKSPVQKKKSSQIGINNPYILNSDNKNEQIPKQEYALKKSVSTKVTPHHRKFPSSDYQTMVTKQQLFINNTNNNNNSVNKRPVKQSSTKNSEKKSFNFDYVPQLSARQQKISQNIHDKLENYQSSKNQKHELISEFIENNNQQLKGLFSVNLNPHQSNNYIQQQLKIM